MEEISEAKEQVPHNESNNLRKEKIKNWLKDKNNLTFLGILIFSIVIRIYFFNLTKTQALWWDEADYLAYAKNLAGAEVSWIASAKHNSLYSFLIAGIFKVGFSEAAAKFILQFIPSILTIIVVYLLANKMYEDKRIGLISSFLMSVFWIHLFNTTRFHIDISGLFLGLLALYIFWKGHEKKEKIFRKINANWAITLAAILSVLAYSIRRGYFLFGLFIIVHVFLTNNWKELIKDKYNWAGLIGGLILFFIVEKTIFISGIGSVGESYFHEEIPINFLPLKVFNEFFNVGGFLSGVLFYLFYIGIILFTLKIILSFGQMKKVSESKSDLFNLLIIIITLGFFIFVLRTQESLGESRWYLPLAFSAFVSIARASTFFADLIKPYSKHLAVILLILIIGFAGYYQCLFSDSLIKNKVNSYSGIREMSLFLKEISNKDDIILTMGQPQVEYYSERKTVNARKFVEEDQYSEEHFYQSMERLKEEENIRYILITFSEPGYPLWMKKDTYAQNELIAWEIPFMQTKMDFTTGEQRINEEATYENMTFKLVNIKQEVFLYEIIRN